MLIETTGIHPRIKKNGHVPKFTRGIHPRNQIYHHPKREEIEIECALKRYPSHVLAKKYGVNPGAIRRYRSKNMSKEYIDRIRSVGHIDPDLYEADNVLKYKNTVVEMIDRIQTEQLALIALKSEAMKDKSYQAAGQLAAEIRKNMELECRLRGFLEARNVGRGVTINNNNNVLVDAEPKDQEPDLSSLSVDELEALMSLTMKIEAANNPKIKVIDHVR